MAAGDLTYDIYDAKAIPFTNGTFGTAVDVPGIRSLAITPEGTSEAVTGDGTVIAYVPTDSSVGVSMEMALLNPAAFAAIGGGSLVTAGTGPDATVTFVGSARLKRPVVQLHGLAPGAGEDGGTVEIVLYKAIANSGPNLTFARELSYPTIDLDLIGMGGAFYHVTQHVGDDFELAGTAVTTPPSEA